MHTRVYETSEQVPIPGPGEKASEPAPPVPEPIVIRLRFVGRSWGFSPNTSANTWRGSSSVVGVGR